MTYKEFAKALKALLREAKEAGLEVNQFCAITKLEDDQFCAIAELILPTSQVEEGLE